MNAPALRLGCIADDYTGATDLANNLVRGGRRVLQTFGVPAAGSLDADDVEDAGAIVIALKTRTAPREQAVAESLAACDALLAAGARRFYFKVCSTFDSTPRGNIGPVVEALMDRLAAPFCVVTPAFPALGRSVYQGHLFVGDQLLSDSPMRRHPLTPMTDANLLRVLQLQLARRRVGLIDRATVSSGPQAVASRIGVLQGLGVTLAIADALDDSDLRVLGAALQDAPLVCAGSGLAIGLAATDRTPNAAPADRLPPASGTRAIVSGSCSPTSLAQVEHFVRGGGAAWAIDPLQLAGGPAAPAQVVAQTLTWARPRLATGPVLVYATAASDAVERVQRALGVERAGALVEHTLAAIAAGLVSAGVGQLVVAGGETSGACVQALNVQQMHVGPQIAPGVPWCHASRHGARTGGLHIALKSGNFGSADFYERAFQELA